MKEIIRCTDVSYRYGKQYVLRGINLIVEENDFMAIVGPNGGGKSTLLKLILGLIEPESGNIVVLGDNPSKSSSRIGYVPQYGDYDISFPLKVLDIVLMSSLGNRSYLPWYRRSDREKALAQLKFLGVDHLAERKLDELSGGQRQRVLIARALMSEPEILILDEPTANIDSAVEGDVYRMLQELNKRIAILLVSHDITFVSTFVNKVTCMNICSCTHKLEEIDGPVIEEYNYSLKVLQHRCKL